MKSTKHILSILLLLSLSFTSCEKDDGNSIGEQQEIIPDTFSEYFGNTISRDFLGTVVDKNQLPIPGALISIGNDTALTDSNGVFIIRDANVNKRFGYVRAEKVGYIHASRSVVPTDGTNKVNIMMLNANITGSVNSGSTGTVSLSNGSSVSFDGNFIKEDGSAYSGSVDVIMHHLNPTDDDMTMQMPGMLYAQNNDGAERMLQTIGMLAVELRGNNGEDLNLATGSTSEIKIPIDASLMSTAPSTIPLWYFDEVNGYWKEEGQATLQGNMYVGTVSHFSFWNCDIPTETVTFCLTATNDDNNAIGNLSVRITSGTYGTFNGYLNEDGEICGLIPSGEILELDVYNSYFCGNDPLYSQTIGSFNTDSSLSVIIPDNPNLIPEIVTGDFTTCDGNVVTDGYVRLTYGEQTYTDLVSDGTFEINLFRCAEDNNFSIDGNDYTNLQTTGIINYTFTTSLTNVESIIACNDINEFINYTIDNEETFHYLNNITQNFPWNDNLMSISADGIDGCFDISIYLNESSYEGSYNQVNGNLENTDFGWVIGACLPFGYNNNDNIVFYITSFGNTGDYIDINFNGNYYDYQQNTHTVSGIIHVLRDN